MPRKRFKFTDQEWLSLIQDCKASSLTINAWCEENGITHKALDYHIRQLRQKGYAIPGKKAKTASLPERQEVFCLDLSEELPGKKHLSGMPGDTAIRIDYHGVLIEVTNQAAQETLSNTFLALRNLC